MRADIEARLGDVRARIEAAAASCGRDGDEITLVAVSKSFSADVVAQALEAGARDLGENRAQELKEKAIALPAVPRWHFIGHLQTNKARHVVGTAHLIHSIDRLALAEEISRRARVAGVSQDVLIEVNISGEPTKHGVEPLAAVTFAQQVDALDGIRVRGAMTMAPFTEEAELSRPFFSDLRTIGERLRELLPAATELSMGMTRDFEVAVQEGATLVRIGEAIFGPRPG